jgi:hypothetical protein
LVDAQEFEHLKFERKRFTTDLLPVLLDNAGEPSLSKVIT